MTNRAMQFIAAGAILLSAASLNAQGPQKRGDRPAPGASASPVPASAAPNASSSTAIFNAPQHSPDQLDFGTVSAGASSLKTFTLTTNASGNVSVTIPPGPFRIAEFRELGPLQGGSKNSANPLNTGGFSPPQVKSRITYREGQNGPFQWSMAPNEQIQLDIIFAPKSQTISGVSSAVMNVNGPGPHGNWVVTIPLRGTTNAMRAMSPEGSQPSVTHTGATLPLSGKGGGSSPPMAAPSSVSAAMSNAAGSPNVAELLKGSEIKSILKQRNTNLSSKGYDTVTLATLTRQKQAADLRLNAIGSSKSLAVASGKISANRNPGPTGSGPKNVDDTASMAPITDALACAHAYPRPVILAVDTVRRGIIFIPDPDDNPYVFEGCNFGDAPGSLYLTATPAFAHGKIDLQIKSWSDTKIVAIVPPDITGELDHNDVQVKLIKADTKWPESFSGHKFSALREEQWLTATNAQLSMADPFQPCGDGNSPLLVCKYESPALDAPKWPFQTLSPTLGVLRISNQYSLNGKKGTDSITLNSLPPGFAVSQIILGLSFQASPIWSIKINGNTIEVGFVFQGPSSTYFMNVYVVGPKGVHL